MRSQVNGGRYGATARLRNLGYGLAATAVVSLCAAPAPVLAQAADAAPALLEVKRFEIRGDNPLSVAETEATLAPHLGVHRDIATLDAAALALEARMRDAGYAFHRVVVPAQRPADGVIRLEVLRFVLGSANVTGQTHFSEDNVLRALPALVPGESPDVNRLARQLSIANEHPARRLTITLRESARVDAIDADIRVRDVRPSQFFANLIGHSRDAYNVINENTGYTRLTLGYQNSNLFDRDHVFTAAYTTSPEHPERVSQYALFYALPLYAHYSNVSVYYVRSDIDTGAIPAGIGQSFHVSGRGEFYGLRWTWFLPRLGDMNHQVSAALDERTFETSVNFAGNPLPQTPVTTRPLSLRYQVRADRVWGSAGLHAEYVRNAGGSDDRAFDSLRAGARNDWSAWRFGADASYIMGNWLLVGRLRAQHSGAILIPGEQFGIGGAATVRGYREREYAGERGYALTVETVGPVLYDTVRPVAFVDHGSATLRGASVGGSIVGTHTATSIGGGLRWNWQRRLDVAADLAYTLDELPSTATVRGTPNGRFKLHFSVFFRF